MSARPSAVARVSDALFASGLLVLAACSGSYVAPGPEPRGPSSGSSVALEPSVAREFERHGIRPTSASNEFLETMPADLMATSSWGTKIGPCRAGGYDLTVAAGRPVRLLRYAIDERIQGEPLYVFAVMDGETVACVFRSVREGSETAPGVYPAS